MDSQLQKYFDLLRKWNSVINLTSIDDEEGFLNRHVEDVRAIVSWIGDAKRLLDLGTGAGIPGIIIKMLRPKIDVTLLDATRKKISFCGEAIRALGLDGIRAAWGRAEDPKMQRALGRYDLVISRATWELGEFLEIAAPYVAEGGRAAAMKGPRWHEELSKAARSMEKSALTLDGTHPYSLPGGEERCLMVFSRP